MNGLAVLLATAAVGYGLSQRFRLPVIPLLLVLGFAVSSLASSQRGSQRSSSWNSGWRFLSLPQALS